jgi:hypothetical protein
MVKVTMDHPCHICGPAYITDVVKGEKLVARSTRSINHVIAATTGIQIPSKNISVYRPHLCYKDYSGNDTRCDLWIVNSGTRYRIRCEGIEEAVANNCLWGRETLGLYNVSVEVVISYE